MHEVERAPKEMSRRRFIAWALVFILVGVLASHIILPVFDLSIVLTGAAIGVLVWIVPILLLCSVLFFLLPFLTAIIFGTVVTVGVIVSIVMLPVLFPLLLLVWVFCALLSALFASS